jgi:hypothetical protein
VIDGFRNSIKVFATNWFGNMTSVLIGDDSEELAVRHVIKDEGHRLLIVEISEQRWGSREQ